MTKRTKRTLFYCSVVIFLVASYVVMLYAQGYKYSFSEGKFQRTGAISLKVNTGARIFVNDKLEGNTSFFNNSFSVDRLLPGKYKLTVQKDSYSFWQKKVTVEEGLVVDFPNALILPEEGEEEQKLFKEVEALFEEAELIPNVGSKNESFVIDPRTAKLYKNENDKPVEIAQSVEGFRLSENKNKLAWWNKNELWVMWLNDQNYQPFYKKEDKELITRFLTPIQNIVWFDGEDHIILELEEHDSKGRPYSIYKVVEIDKRGGLNMIEL